MNRVLLWLSAFACGIVPTVALAHPVVGSASGFTHGFMHPLGGLDHLLAMVLVGMVAYQMGGKTVWLLPLTFVGMMVVGGIAGVAGIPLFLTEVGIALSVVILGLIVAFEVKLPVALTFIAVGIFAIFHGHAHGTEMPAAVSGVTFGFGFVCATALLHALGISFGALTSSWRNNFTESSFRLAGGLAAIFGIVLLVH